MLVNLQKWDAGCRDVEASQQHEQIKGNVLKDGNNGDNESTWLCCRRAESHGIDLIKDRREQQNFQVPLPACKLTRSQTVLYLFFFFNLVYILETYNSLKTYSSLYAGL